jgi:hypothetical protein
VDSRRERERERERGEQGVEMTKGIKDTPARRCAKLHTHLFTSFGTARQCVRDGLKRIMHFQIDMTDVFLYLI